MFYVYFMYFFDVKHLVHVISFVVKHLQQYRYMLHIFNENCYTNKVIIIIISNIKPKKTFFKVMLYIVKP